MTIKVNDMSNTYMYNVFKTMLHYGILSGTLLLESNIKYCKDSDYNYMIT